ncbi:MAG TPA: NAD-dependent epimerase [Pirellulaceae bacterium]|jgi:UDP-glucuronate 4-epimerase|nr:NAD-dependent epimerase [Pirellulaceae bacterium]
MASLLVTGAAGFIGFHLAKRLLAEGHVVEGWDDLNPYYSVRLKQDRLSQLTAHPNFRFRQLSIEDRQATEAAFAETPFDGAVHLAAQAGVRYSIENPRAYIDSNLVGFLNILEGCRHRKTPHLVYASSSSVYGSNVRMPFSEGDPCDHPLSLYGATKKANEMMAHSYSHLYGLPTTGLRFFTVYGPWGRPDMAMYLFADAISQGKPIRVFNQGDMRRDFTYVDDVVEGIVRVLAKPPAADPNWDAASGDPSTSGAPYRVYNLGNHEPVELLELIGLIEKNLGREAIKELLPMQAGDVPETYADMDRFARDFALRPYTPLADGVAKFVAWYREYVRNPPR